MIAFSTFAMTEPPSPVIDRLGRISLYGFGPAFTVGSGVLIMGALRLGHLRSSTPSDVAYLDTDRNRLAPARI